MEKRLVQSFRVIVSIIFIFSAIAKLVSLAFFDGMVAELLLGKEYYNFPEQLYYTQILTRVLISAELLLGASVLQTKNLKTIMLPAIQLMLVAFTIHLFYVSFGYMAEGKSFDEAFLKGNCGCFGDIMPMSNFESIIKNIITMFMVGYIWMKINKFRTEEIRLNSLIPFLLGVVTFGSLMLTVKKYDKQESGVIKEIVYKEEPKETDETPDTLNQEKDTTILNTSIEMTSTPAESVVKEKPEVQIKEERTSTTSQKITSSSSKPKEETVKPVIETEVKAEATTQQKILSYEEVLAKYSKFSNGITADLNQGDKLVCMFSLSCGHCQETYKAICEMADSGKLPNTLLFVYGSDFELNHFFNQAACKHPYIMVEDYSDFKVLLDGHDFPYVLAREKGKNVKTWDLENEDINELIAKHYGIEKKKPAPSNGLFGEEEENGLFGN